MLFFFGIVVFFPPVTAQEKKKTWKCTTHSGNCNLIFLWNMRVFSVLREKLMHETVQRKRRKTEQKKRRPSPFVLGLKYVTGTMAMLLWRHALVLLYYKYGKCFLREKKKKKQLQCKTALSQIFFFFFKPTIPSVPMFTVQMVFQQNSKQILCCCLSWLV